MEVDAEAAEARRAVEAVGSGDLAVALRSAQAACDLEARYHPRLVWADLKEVLQSGGRVFSLVPSVP